MPQNRTNSTTSCLTTFWLGPLSSASKILGNMLVPVQPLISRLALPLHPYYLQPLFGCCLPDHGCIPPLLDEISRFIGWFISRFLVGSIYMLHGWIDIKFADLNPHIYLVGHVTIVRFIIPNFPTPLLPPGWENHPKKHQPDMIEKNSQHTIT